MLRLPFTLFLNALAALAAHAQEPAGSLVLAIHGREQPYVLIQDAEGTNPGSRYSQLGDDVVMTIVGVLGEDIRDPDKAEATIELRFTVDGTGPEARTGSMISYSTRDAEGRPDSRGGTADVAIDSFEIGGDSMVASGTFVAELPPDAESASAEVQGRFQTAMKLHDTREP